jgi:hypothetical protein
VREYARENESEHQLRTRTEEQVCCREMDARQHQPLAALAVHAGCCSSCCCGAYVAAHTSFVAPATPAPAAGGVGLEEASAASEASPLPPAQELQRQLSHLQVGPCVLAPVSRPRGTGSVGDSVGEGEPPPAAVPFLSACTRALPPSRPASLSVFLPSSLPPPIAQPVCLPCWPPRRQSAQGALSSSFSMSCWMGTRAGEDADAGQGCRGG